MGGSKVKVTPDASVSLRIGEVPGAILENGVRQYLGVPYAEPLASRESVFELPKPIAMLRPEMEAGTKESDEAYAVHPFPHVLAACCPCACGKAFTFCCCWACCRATSESTDGKGMGVDVLRMNIWSPPGGKSGPVPVIVWIHGGGDSGNARMSDPNSRSGERLAELQGVVVCCVEFRQGIFGLMDWGAGSDVPTNLELRDMVLALQWIQEHIGAFGGDAACVTIVGESIGGRRICELMWCPAAKGLFHRAIATSPSGAEAANLSEAHRAHRRTLVNKYLGLPEDATPSKAALAQLPRMKLAHAQAAAKAGVPTLPMTKLWGATEEDKRVFGCAAQVPMGKRAIADAALGFLGWRTVDGKRSMWDASAMDGSFMPAPVGGSPPASHVPLLLLFTKDEHAAFEMLGLGCKDVTNRAESLSRLVHLLPVRGVLDAGTAMRLAGDFLDAYEQQVLPGKPLSEVHKAAMQDLWQYHACMAVGEAHSAALPGQTYLCTYEYDCGGGITPHAADVNTIFGITALGQKKGKDFEGMTSIMQDMVATFARCGNPSTPAAPFVSFDQSAPKMTVLDSPRSGGGCKVVDTSEAKNAAYRALVAAIRAAET